MTQLLQNLSLYLHFEERKEKEKSIRYLHRSLFVKRRLCTVYSTVQVTIT